MAGIGDGDKVGVAKSGNIILKEVSKLTKIGRRNRTARSLDVSLLFGAKRGSKACQMAPTMEPKREQIPTNKLLEKWISNFIPLGCDLY